MPSTSPDPDLPDRPLRLAGGLLAGSVLLAIVDAGAIAHLPMPSAGLGLRLAHHVADAAETVGLGALAALVAWAYARFVRLPSWVGFALAQIVTIAILRMALDESLTRAVNFTVPLRLTRAAFVVYLVALGAAFPTAYEVTSSIAHRPRLRLIPVAIALAAMVLDQVPLPDDYHAAHATVAWGAAVVGGGALEIVGARALARLLATARGRVALAAMGLAAALGVLVPPPNAVRYELFRQPCAVAPWALATVLWRAPRLHAPVTVPPSPWFHDRSGDPPVPPTSPRLMPPNPVVVLITVDATRADAVFDPANEEAFPTFTEMRHEGVVFAHAMAPGTQTPLSLASTFSGRTFSEQLWTEYGEGRTRFQYPAEDTSPRFPEVLSRHGVATFETAGLIFLGNDWGVVRGFETQLVAVRGTRHAQAVELVDPLLSRLRHTGNEPAFLYTHLMEPHEPYDRGRKDGTPRERYLSEIAIADKHIGRVLRYLRARFPGRWALFVSADHGEAFGEHGTHEHAKSLYEELVHVPLLAVSPLFQPRTVDERVSLVDLGPTILDLFGQATPATFLGQSLVPILAGGHVELTRPIWAEGRLRRALMTPDGLKVIEDLRRKCVEVYDVPNDPGETRNLFDVDPARSDRALATLRAFFDAHTRRVGGYEPPFKP